MARPIYVIAGEIIADYASRGKPVHPYAAPYVEAMQSLNDISDMYINERGDMIVRYALGNLTTWRGEKAREIKAELKAML